MNEDDKLDGYINKQQQQNDDEPISREVFWGSLRIYFSRKFYRHLLLELPENFHFFAL